MARHGRVTGSEQTDGLHLEREGGRKGGEEERSGRDGGRQSRGRGSSERATGRGHMGEVWLLRQARMSREGRRKIGGERGSGRKTEGASERESEESVSPPGRRLAAPPRKQQPPS